MVARTMNSWLLLSLLVAGCGVTPPEPDQRNPSPLQTPDVSEGLPLHVAFLVVDGVYNSELTAPFDIFHHTIFHADPGMRVFTVGRSRDPVTTFEGLRIGVDHSLEDAPRIDVLVVPSAEGSMTVDLADARLIDWVRERGRAARTIVSICDGAFVLAEAGLLDGRQCTTFPGDIPALRERYPALHVVEGVTFVADGRAITGVGGARSFEPALYLVQKIYGEEAARGVARGMVIDWDLEKESRLVMPEGARVASYLPGDLIDGEVCFETADGSSITVGQLAANSEAAAVALCFFGGAANTAEPARGGLWCEDSFHDLSLVRRLHEDFAARGVLFIGVLCPPVHHETRFGFHEGSFLDRPDSDPQYQQDRRGFVSRSEELAAEGSFPFDRMVYDLRVRALADPRQATPTPATGPAPTWQGRFKWFDDSQMYGTPTIWILDRELRCVGPPFVQNNYEGEGGKIRYDDRAVRLRLEVALERGRVAREP